ncbi:DUF6113 family protein [Jiangella gansuensis]|uniref:DUF6113 family protein n=1 Tax=Jiangella gansuensis TaxID=281473 RepID=UPI0012FB6C76|nr:DUF6113 family protein [Jiangella gansuensis]
MSVRGRARRSRVHWWSLAGLVGLAPIAVVVAVSGAFVHRWASPVGLLLALGGVIGLAVLARVCARSRIGLGVVALLWLAPVLALAQGPAGEDRIVGGDEAGLVFLFGGTMSLAIALGRGVEARSTRRVT